MSLRRGFGRDGSGSRCGALLLANQITQQAQDDKMAQKSGENPEKEAPEKLIDAVLTEVFS